MNSGILDALRAGISFGTTEVAVFALVSACTAALLLAIRPQRPQERLETRLGSVSGDTGRGKDEGHLNDQRRRQVEDTIRELQAKEKARGRHNAKPTLTGRLRQAGLSWSRYTYLLVSLTAGLIAFAAALSGLGLGVVTSAGFGVAGGLLLPHFYVGLRRTRRQRAFGSEFPNALDVIVRGVQAGLPLSDCLRVIASDAQEPVGGEFRHVVHDQTLGVPLDSALARMVERVPLSEVSFFAIVLTVQARTGGNLSEALSNLSKVLRDRKKMRQKITALSSEAKASAGIIGAMPVAVAGLLYLTSPDYIELMFITSTGQLALVLSGLWMLTGCLVMRKMINFDF